jgi:RNase H
VDQKPVPVPAATVVYTDGACSGNPGPGGWAWAVPRGRYASGARAWTTNQRMEIMAVLEAAKAFDGPLEVVSDSTYVINCFRDRWWEGWLLPLRPSGMPSRFRTRADTLPPPVSPLAAVATGTAPGCLHRKRQAAGSMTSR